MQQPSLSLELISQILQSTIPQQAPSLIGHTPDWGIFLATYKNFHNCHVPEHNAPFLVLEIIDETPLLCHRRILGDRRIESLLNGGEVSIYPAYANYFFDSSDGDQREGIDFTLLGLDTVLIEEFAEEIFGYRQVEITPQFLVADTQQVRSLVNIMKQEMIDGYPNGILFLEDIRNALIRCLLRKAGTSRKSTIEKDIAPLTNKRVQLIKELLRENLRKNISLEELETYFGVSKFHLSRSFQQVEGISLTAYIKQIRVELAQQLLTHKSWSIARIAQECGFHDASHLNRYFKALTGITPSQFREQFQKRIDI